MSNNKYNKVDCQIMLVNILGGFSSIHTKINADNDIIDIYNYHLRDPNIMGVVDKLLLIRGDLKNSNSKRDPQLVAVLDRWLLFGGGR